LTGEELTVSNSVGNGIRIDDATVTLAAPTIRDNLRAGIVTSQDAASVTLTGSGVVSNNGRSGTFPGVLVERGLFTLNGNAPGFQVDTNTGAGVLVRGTSGAVSITRARLHSNGEEGLLVEDAVRTSDLLLTFRNNQVDGNGAPIRGVFPRVGGVHILQAAELAPGAFQGNDIHNNAGHQLGIGRARSGGVTSVISAGAGGCGVLSNALHGYAPNATGLSVYLDPAIATPLSLDATQVSWANPVAQEARDYVVSPNAAVLTADPCAPSSP